MQLTTVPARLRNKRQGLSITSGLLPTFTSDTTTSSSTTTSSTTSSSSSTTSSSSSSSTTSTTSSTSTSTSSSSQAQPSTSISIIQTTITVDGSTSVSSITSSAVVTNPAQNSSGLSSGAKAGIIGGVVGGVGGILALVALFFLWRCIKRRRSDYVPNQDELKWPEMQEDSGALFPAAVKRNSGHGFGASGLDRGDTMRSGLSAGTAGIAATTLHSPTQYQGSNMSHNPYSSEYSNEHYETMNADGQPQQYQNFAGQRNSYYDPQAETAMYGNQQTGYYPETGDAYAGYGQEQYHQAEQAQYQHDRPLSTESANLDRYGSVMSRSEQPYNLHIANA